ncbi:MAG: DNA-directed RNA polymerase subunit beta [Candidatus Poribacteria bacterium]|nr:DNA-directed RNA polymerase subunit beta [Candidatus Poribacteria bacterium]
MPNISKTNGSPAALRQRVSFAKTQTDHELPDLIETQKRSYTAFLQRFVSDDERESKGLQALFEEVFPIYDFKETTSLEFVSYTLSPPTHDLSDCQARGLNYQVRLQARLMCVEREKDDDTGQTRVLDITESEVYLGDIPLMTENGTFIINGSERVIVNQLQRSPGVIFLDKSHASSVQKLPTGQIIPYRGAWIEFEYDSKDCIHVRLDRKKKLLVTVLLRALGWETDAEILKLFGKTEVVAMNQDVIGRVIAESVINKKTGEVLLEANTKLSEIEFDRLMEAKISEVEVLLESDEQKLRFLRNTLSRDTVKAYAGGTLQEGALLEIFRTLRPGDAPTREAASSCLERLFFDGARYDLGVVGRYKINSKLGDLSTYQEESGEMPSEDIRVLRKEDIAATLQYLMDIRNGHRNVDDLDHLGNRRVRVIGELLENQFRIALLQIRRSAREKLSTTTDAQLKNPKNIIVPKPLMMSLREFFGSNQLSQFMQQINPLDELTHKRRISAIGPGGLHRDRATAAVRDVHRTHYGRVCPLETPEGPSIGLIVSLATFARVNPYGFLETPYRSIRNGKITKEVEYLTADAEDKFNIAPADAITKGKRAKSLRSRKGEEVIERDITEIDYIGIAPQQIVGVSAALVPFLEHEDANRALMGANHQRQAVPLIRPEAPWVGTGMEHRAARDANAMVVAQRGGVVSSVDAEEILIRTGQALHQEEGEHTFSEMGYDVYKLKNFKRSNSGTCIHQRPRVNIGDTVEVGDVIADGTATEGGELALGRNILCSYMPWGGHNFEDSILISESLIKEDTFTSIHIEEFEVAARQTKMGDEEITRDIPNMSPRSLSQLDDEGIIRIGSVVGTGSILVGKISPKGESESGPEEKLLRAIFGEKVKEVKDASAYTRPGVEGVVIDVKVFSRQATPSSDQTAWRQEAQRKQIEQTHQEQRQQVLERLTEGLRETLVNKELAYPTTFVISNDSEDADNVESPTQLNAGDVLTREYLETLSQSELETLQVTDEGTINYIKSLQELATGRIDAYTKEKNDALEKLDAGEELKPGVLKLVKVYVASRRPISVGDKMAGRYGNKGVVAKILPEEDMPYMPDGTPVDIVLNPLGVPSRMNVGQILEIHLGLACKELDLHISSPVFDGATEEEVFSMLDKTDLPENVKETGKSVLYDGRTGEPFGQEVTVGYVYFLKLNHLVADKMHARSTGPYSLVTQQPLGGKAQHGGQRLGEMEVWALEAYGAAHTLQEMLTIKSDDVKGRTKIYESIVKGQSPMKPGTPESFNVLVRELQSLGLNVELTEGDPADADAERKGLHDTDFPLLHTLDTMEPIEDEPPLKLTWDTDDTE